MGVKRAIKSAAMKNNRDFLITVKDYFLFVGLKPMPMELNIS